MQNISELPHSTEKQLQCKKVVQSIFYHVMVTSSDPGRCAAWWNCKFCSAIFFQNVVCL